ncbi:hypothetical protein P8A22_15675 [Streptomyces laculatispora]|uniref:Uncharacterized protein n=1 Tax=Streptomyces laculatispora TaxID=887464 RepID=A0ABY9I382_9ACTN|nr:hypothetical protein [Streptomyces laculatispora]WLQ41303.1 hypothetical protein P8A22_15675 [Streptomyces laculatispora]
MDGSTMVIGAQDRLADVMAAVIEVAAESGESGTYTADVARTLTAVVGKVAARIAVEAETRGFRSGWGEAVALTAGGKGEGAQVFRM